MSTINYNINYEIEQQNNHITFENRKTIANMLKSGKFTLLDIGIAIGKSKSTICKEILRNGTLKPYSSRVKRKNPLKYYKNYNYYAKKAHNNYLKVFMTPKYLTKFKFCLEWINKTIQHHNSMYDILQEFIQQHPDQSHPSESTLYYYWHKGIVKYKSTRVPRKKRGKNEVWFKDSNKVSIEERDPIVKTNTEYGHWEIDMVIDGDHKGGLVTINERVSKQYFAYKANDKYAHTINQIVDKFISVIGAKNIKTITSDNGPEFAYHHLVTDKHSIPWYFCHPYCSGERGLNEHLNGELRFFCPKGTSFYNMTQENVDIIVSKINNKHRKILFGQTAHQTAIKYLV